MYIKKQSSNVELINELHGLEIVRPSRLVCDWLHGGTLSLGRKFILKMGADATMVRRIHATKNSNSVKIWVQKREEEEQIDVWFQQ